MRRVQYSLFPNEKPELEFGGSLNSGKRKGRRPIALKRPMHLTLRSSYSSLGHFRKGIIEIIKEEALKWGVNVYRLSVNSNHLHMALRTKSRWGFQSFLKT